MSVQRSKRAQFNPAHLLQLTGSPQVLPRGSRIINNSDILQESTEKAPTNETHASNTHINVGLHLRAHSAGRFSKLSASTSVENIQIHNEEVQAQDGPLSMNDSQKKRNSLTPDNHSSSTMLTGGSGRFSSRPSTASVARKLLAKQLKVDLSRKSQLIEIPPQKKGDHKATHLSHESERKMLHQFYLRKPGDKTSVNYKFQNDTSEPHFQNLTKEERELQEKMYEKFRRKFDKMIFDQDRNYLYFKPTKEQYDKGAIPDSAGKQKTKEMVIEIQEKVENLRPESLLKTTKSEKPRYMKSTKQAYDDCRDQKLDLLGTKLRGLRNEVIVEKARSTIADMSDKAGLMIDKLEDEKVTGENQGLSAQIEEVQKENAFLKRKTQMLQQDIIELTAKNEALRETVDRLEFLEPVYNALQTKFKDADVTNILAKIERLEGYCQEYVKRILELEEDLRRARGETRNIMAQMEEKSNVIQNEQQERNKLIKIFRDEISGLESEMKTKDNHQQDYLRLSNRVMSLYSNWVGKLDVYTNIDDQPSLNAKPNDPIEMLDIMERLVKITTPETMQKYIKSIIVSANQLRRKYLPKFVNIKFDPDKIYEMLNKYIQYLENENKRLKLPIGQESRKKMGGHSRENSILKA